MRHSQLLIVFLLAVSTTVFAEPTSPTEPMVFEGTPGGYNII